MPRKKLPELDPGDFESPEELEEAYDDLWDEYFADDFPELDGLDELDNLDDDSDFYEEA